MYAIETAVHTCSQKPITITRSKEAASVSSQLGESERTTHTNSIQCAFTLQV